MKLLFVGNSHTYYNAMPELVRRLFEATGQKTHVTMVAEGGKTLANLVGTQNTVFNLRYGGYDMVIAQDKATGFDAAAFEGGAKALKELCDKSRTPLYFYMPWAPRDARSQQGEMTDAYSAFCRKNGCFFAPVGEVFGRMLLTEQPHSLYREDGCHATPFGSYVAAVTIFYTVTGRKRIMKVQELDDPGVAMGFPVELCQRVHTEACRTMRLFNG